MDATPRLLLDFVDDADFAPWSPVDDVVMGGVSRSEFTRAGASVARFAGLVSLDFGGGFASCRTRPRTWSTAGARAFVLRVRGDGRTYKFTVRTDDGYSDCVLPCRDFVASFRGRPVRGAPPLDPARVRALGFMISEKQAGPFELQVDWIAVVDR